MDSDLRFYGLTFLLLGVVMSIPFWVPVIFRWEIVQQGEVSSVSVSYGIIPITTINFRDGSSFTVWGKYDIPIGIRRIVVRSSAFLIYELVSWE